MRFIRFFLIPLLALGLSLETKAQTVRGLVEDSFGSPLPGVGVVEKGTLNGVVTAADGTYSIQIKDDAAVLEFSFLGMKPLSEEVKGREVINVRLEDDAIGLQEVIAIGYGSMKREEITTSIVRVKSDDFVKGGVSSPLGLLQGKVAGLGMSTTSGDPSASPSISLRGISTLAASSSPLIVIDGIAGGSLNSIAPEDIESIDVLKDGSAAAIYGTRGTNGVIIINTRRPQSGETSLEYGAYVKLDALMGERDVLNASEWREMMANEEIPAGIRSLMQDYGSQTDWVREISRNPVSHNHYLSARGGARNTNYSASVTYADKEGIYETSFDKSLAVKLAINHNMFDDRLRMSFNMGNKTVKHGNCPAELYNDATLWNPTFPMYDENGDYYMTNNQTPICALKEWKGVNSYDQLSMSGKITLKVLESLSVSVTGAYQGDYNEDEWWGTHKTYSAHLGDRMGEATLSGGHGDDRTLELQVDWSRSWADHNLNATAGYSWNRYFHQSWSMNAYDFPIEGSGAWNIGSAESTLEGESTINSYKWERKLIGFFGRVNYNYANKYLFMASLRREGSDKFGANNRWGWFPSVSAGWRITNEDFMKSIGWIDELKLRAGYGVTGTEPSSAYQYIALYNFDSSSMSYSDGKWVTALVPANNPNPDLKWEEKHEANIGLDYAFLGSRIRGSLDAYYRKTKDLLYNYTVPVPPNISGSMLTNVGSIMNKGLELSIEGDAIRKKDLSLTVGANLSFNRNELLKLSNDTYTLEYLKLGNLPHVQTYSHYVEEHQPIGNFYGFKQLGLKNSGTEWRILGAENASAGESEKMVIGNGIPSIFAGFNASMSYKGLDLSVSFHGAFKYQILNQYRMMYETLAWIQTYNVPRAAYEKHGDYYNTAPSTYCDYYIENGDYLKMDNLTLGYRFNTSSSKYFKNIRVYVTGKNLLTITSYKGMDPEAVNITGLTPGIDGLSKYPTLRSVTAGVNLNF